MGELGELKSALESGNMRKSARSRGFGSLGHEAPVLVDIRGQELRSKFYRRRCTRNGGSHGDVKNGSTMEELLRSSTRYQKWRIDGGALLTGELREDDTDAER
jgi:hypothetical protein